MIAKSPSTSVRAGGLRDLTQEPRRAKGSPLPLLCVLLLLAGGGYFGWRLYSQRQTRKPADPQVVRRQSAAPKAEPETNAVAAVERPQPVRPREKTPEEILAEEAAARKAVLDEIAAARKDPNAKPLTRFAGVTFGEPVVSVSGEPVRWGTVLDEDEAADASLDARGATFSVYGPSLQKPLLSFGSQPLVWVTPKTRRAYRVEFSRPLALRNGARHDAETTNVVAYLRRQPIFKDCKVFAPTPLRPNRPGCEFVMPLGASTVTVGEYGRELRFSVEQGDVKRIAKEEADAARKERRANLDDGKALDSARYPHGDFGKYPRMKFKDGTPKSFCGVTFGRVAAAGAALENPRHGERGFFLNYRKGKCPVFRGFDMGRAETDRVRGGVFAVRLFSPGGAEGLDDADYFDNVGKTLAEHYKVQPTSKELAGRPFPELTYTVGDVTIAFGPEADGGFYLYARHEALAALAKQNAPAPRKKRR